MDEESAIRSVELTGFKSIFSPVRVDFAPLTLLAGANSSGKSSFMQALLLLKQTLEAQIDPGPIKLSGPNVSFSNARDFYSNLGADARLDELKISFRDDRGELKFELILALSEAGPIEVKQFIERSNVGRLRLRPGMSSAEIESQLDKSSRFIYESICDPAKPLYSVEANRFLLRINLAASDPSKAVRQWILDGLHRQLLDFLRGFIHLPGLRGNPTRRYLSAGTGPTFDGIFGPEYTAALLDAWGNEKANGAKGRMAAVRADLQTLGLTSEVKAQRLSDSEIQIFVGRMPTTLAHGGNDMVNIADVGIGVSQILPLIVALHAAGPQNTVYVEQPELHLHPRAQVKLATVLAQAVKRGARVVVETHSALLLLALQTLVAEGKGDLAAEQIKLYWFSRDAESGETRVNPAALDADGAFGDRPEDFGQVEMELESRYLDAVDARHRIA